MTDASAARTFSFSILPLEGLELHTEDVDAFTSWLNHKLGEYEDAPFTIGSLGTVPSPHVADLTNGDKIITYSLAQLAAIAQMDPDDTAIEYSMDRNNGNVADIILRNLL
jgi:hypothetical protein